MAGDMPDVLLHTKSSSVKHLQIYLHAPLSAFEKPQTRHNSWAQVQGEFFNRFNGFPVQNQKESTSLLTANQARLMFDARIVSGVGLLS